MKERFGTSRPWSDWCGAEAAWLAANQTRDAVEGLQTARRGMLPAYVGLAARHVLDMRSVRLRQLKFPVIQDLPWLPPSAACMHSFSVNQSVKRKRPTVAVWNARTFLVTLAIAHAVEAGECGCPCERQYHNNMGLPPVPRQARVVGVGPQRKVYEGCFEAHDNSSRESGLL